MTISITTATIAENDLQELCSRLVQREVCYTVSNLIYMLAKGVGERVERELGDLMEQAYELARPVDDWETAAFEAGWLETETGYVSHEEEPSLTSEAETWQELCEEQEIEPHQTEVYEHWLVTDWLAEKLKEQGERIDDDFAGMTVWARTTTGQAISMDYVIRQIVKKLHDVKEAE